MRTLWTSISRREWRIVTFFSIVLIVVTSLPVALGFLRAPVGTTYNGLHALSPGDLPVYYSYIRQVSSGQLTLHDNLTSEPQRYGTFNIWWLLVGGLNALIGDHVVLAFQFARVLMIPIFTVSAYLFISYMFPDTRRRIIAFIFVLFASGVGAYGAPIIDSWGIDQLIPYPWPTDLWISESITFNALYHSSHFIASITAMLWIFLLFLLSTENRQTWYAVVAGLVALAFFNFHPYYAPVIALVIGGYGVLELLRNRRMPWRSFIAGSIIGLMGAPSVVHHYWLLIHEPIVAARAQQNVTLISPWPYVLLGFGFLIPTGLLGTCAFIKKHTWHSGVVLLIVWGIVNSVLMFSPIAFQSRYTQGTQLVLAILSAYGVVWLYDWLQSRLSLRTVSFWLQNQVLVVMLFILLYMPSTLYIVARDTYYFWATPASTRQFFYTPHSLRDAGAWLASNDPYAVVFGSELGSRFLSMNTSNRFYIAHAHETIHYEEKNIQAQQVLKENLDPVALRAWLQDNNIDYVLLSDYEKAWGLSTQYLDAILSVSYRNDSVTLYRVPTE